MISSKGSEGGAEEGPLRAEDKIMFAAVERNEDFPACWCHVLDHWEAWGAFAILSKRLSYNRLETRTKESNTIASLRVINP